jgi:hypothetical protein
MALSQSSSWKRLFLLLLTQVFLCGCAAGREASRSAPEEGRMVVKCFITTQGTVTHCRVLKNVPSITDEVLLSLHLRRYQPVRLHGQPVQVDYTFNIQWTPPKAGASSSSSSEPDEAALRKEAAFLCRHQLLDAPVVSRLPLEVNPFLLIRAEDLFFLQQNPSVAPLTELDKRNLYADLAHYVSCEVTDVRVSRDVAVVSLERSAPYWEHLPLDSPELRASPRSSLERIEALGRWVQEKATRGSPSTHQLRFVKTPKGWRADYQLPEGAQPQPGLAPGGSGASSSGGST